MNVDLYHPVAFQRLASVTALLTLAVSIAVFGFLIYLAATLPEADPNQVPPEMEPYKWILPLYRQYTKTVLVLASAAGFCVSMFIFLVCLQVLRSDTIKVFGIEAKISDELRSSQESAARERRLRAALAEDVREIQKLVERINLAVRFADEQNYLEALDEIAATASTMMRPEGRPVRVSVWLLNPGAREKHLRIVAAARVSAATRKNLDFDKDGDGFAAEVLRAGRTIAEQNPDVGRTWARDRWSTHSTTSIIGQPIEVGNPGGWQAVLCFSTDRDLTEHPQYRFSVNEDAAQLDLFALLISTVLSLAESVERENGDPLLEYVWKRYNR